MHIHVFGRICLDSCLFCLWVGSHLLSQFTPGPGSETWSTEGWIPCSFFGVCFAYFRSIFRYALVKFSLIGPKTSTCLSVDMRYGYSTMICCKGSLSLCWPLVCFGVSGILPRFRQFLFITLLRPICYRLAIFTVSCLSVITSDSPCVGVRIASSSHF